MRRTHARSLTAAALVLAAAASPALAQDASRKVAGGGVTAPGWTGRVDASEAANGQTLQDAKFALENDVLHVTTGPSATWWMPSSMATGNYTVRATFREPAYMSLNNHPHPYGIVIGGSAMDTEQPRYLYCAAYGNGNFIVRGFGPEAFQLNGRRGEANPAVNKAAGTGEPVVQEIAVTVKDDVVECAINGTVVGSYPKSQVVGPGRLATTDGLYGVRVGHNAEVMVTGFGMTKPVTK